MQFNSSKLMFYLLYDRGGMFSLWERYGTANLHQVPPIVISMISNRFLFDKFDLSSVTEVFTGAAHLDAAICRSLLMQYPSWKIRQAYGQSESCSV